MLLRVLQCSPHSGPTGPPAKQALLPDQLPSDQKALLVLSFNPVVNIAPVKHPGNEVVSDSLDLIRLSGHVQAAGQRQIRADRVDPDDFAVRDDLLKPPSDAGDRAAGAGADHDVVDLAVALIQYLLGRAVVVGERVGGVRVLVQDVRVRDLLLEVLGLGAGGKKRKVT